MLLGQDDIPSTTGLYEEQAIERYLPAPVLATVFEYLPQEEESMVRATCQHFLMVHFDFMRITLNGAPLMQLGGGSRLASRGTDPAASSPRGELAASVSPGASSEGGAGTGVGAQAGGADVKGGLPFKPTKEQGIMVVLAVVVVVVSRYGACGKAGAGAASPG